MVVGSLARIAPFDRLPPEVLDRVAGMSRSGEMAPGDWLIRQGADSRGKLLGLLVGKASIIAEGDGEERTVGCCGPGDLLGVTGALTGAPHPVGIRADTRVQYIEVPQAALELGLANPHFAAFFSRTLAERLRRAYRELVPDDALRRLDAQLFRRRIGELMRTPLVTCSPELPVQAVAGILALHGVSSVLVTAAEQPVGIVTDRDLVTKVVAAGLPGSAPVAAIMSAPVRTIGTDALHYEALIRMLQAGHKHLPVIDAEGRAVGMVTLTDLARARGEGALRVVGQIERAATVADLRQLAPRIDDVLRGLVADGLKPAIILPVVAELYDRLTRRLITLAVESLGEPPCDWCWLQLGSAGRCEQFSQTDQDNALIYAGEGERVDAYFAQLAHLVVDGLADSGFARCPGNVMATNPAWRRSLTNWRFQVLQMVHQPGPDQIRLATIFLDFRPVAGTHALATALQEQVWVGAEAVPLFLYHLVRDDLSHRVPVGLSGMVKTPWWGQHRGQINLKGDACVHVVDLLRALALKHRVAETGTLARLRALVRLGAVGRDEGEWLDIAYQTLMRLRIQDALRRTDAGEPPSPYIELRSLSGPERESLRDALVAVARLQEAVGSALAPGGGP